MFYRDFDRTFRNMERLRQRLDRAFDELDGSRGYESGETLAASRFPYVSLEDKGKEFEVTAWLPGMSEKDIEIKIHQDVLTLAGERKNEAPEGYIAHRQERATVRFSRSLAFPAKVDPEKATATLKDGILSVTLAKAAEAQPRQISIRTSG
jgi:HSP20 family protein